MLVERPPGHETMSVVIPWWDRRFQCTTKDNTRPATGTDPLGRPHDLRADGAWGCLDFGRGKWPLPDDVELGRRRRRTTAQASACRSAASGRTAPA